MISHLSLVINRPRKIPEHTQCSYLHAEPGTSGKYDTKVSYYRAACFSTA